MSRKVQPLDGDVLEELPQRCRACLFWELGHPRPDIEAASGDVLEGDPVVQKQAWCTAQALEHAAPGRAVRVDGVLAGFALFAPVERFAPRRGPVPTANPDALLLATLHVEPSFRDAGIGRLLVQAALKDALRQDLRAVEAYGDRRYRESQCVLPATWLLHEGFVVASEHPRYPLLRMDTKRTVRWASAIENAVEEVLDRFPRRVHLPVPDSGPGGSVVPEPQRSVGLPGTRGPDHT